MSRPTWYFDGDKRRLYEVPPGASFTTNGNGYRVYDGGPAPMALLTVDVQRDLWSRWIDWQALNDWARLAFSRSGGNPRPTGEFAPADFSLRTSDGWRMVLANYPHETIFYGNLFAEGADSLFDNSRLTAAGVVPRLQGSANLLTYRHATGGADAAAVAEAVWAHATAAVIATRLAEAWARLGLDPARPLVTGDTAITFGDIAMALAQSGNTVTVTRQ